MVHFKFHLPVVYAYLMLICAAEHYGNGPRNRTLPSQHRARLLASLVGIFCVARKVLFALKEVDGVC